MVVSIKNLDDESTAKTSEMTPNPGATPSPDNSNSNSNANSPQFSFNISFSQLTESNSNTSYSGFLEIQLDQIKNTDATFTLTQTSNISTVNDFTLSTGTASTQQLVIPAGQKKILIDLTVLANNGLREPDKEIIFTVSGGSEFSTPTVQRTFTLIDDDPKQLLVEPYYPTSGTLWNAYATSSTFFQISRYLKVDDSKFPQPEVTCSGNGNDYCFHSSEVKKVNVSWKTSCDGLSLEDNLGAFEWRCSSSGGSVYFYSVDFKKSKGLKDLVKTDGTGFQSMTVSLYDHSILDFTSASSVWWSNSFLTLNSGNINSSGPRMTLTPTPNTIYVVTQSISSKGIDFGSDGTALVVVSGATFSAASPLTISNCEPGTDNHGTTSCFIDVKQKKYIWIEGQFKGIAGSDIITASQNASGVNSALYGRIHGSQFEGGDAGLQFNTKKYLLSELDFKNNSTAIHFSSAYRNFGYDIKVNNSSSVSIVEEALSLGIKLFNIQIANSKSQFQSFSIGGMVNSISYFKITNGSSILLYGGGWYHTAVDGIVSNGTIGIYSSSIQSVYNHITSANNIDSGAELSNSSGGQMISQSLFVNNKYGFSTDYDDITIHDLYSIDNTTNEILNYNSNLYLSGDLYLGRGSTKCLTLGIPSAPAVPGFIDADCTPDVGTTVNRVLNINSNTLLKKWTNDTLNLHGASGLLGLSFSSITDFFNFENPFRLWVPYNISDLPNTNLQNNCSSRNCGIYDLSLQTEQYQLKSINGTFISNAPCPSKTKGSHAINSTSYFLQATVEYLLDGVGDEDGLCESNEICYFTPSAGANLDEPWKYNQTCIYDPDGSTNVTNVTIYGRQL